MDLQVEYGPELAIKRNVGDMQPDTLTWTHISELGSGFGSGDIYSLAHTIMTRKTFGIGDRRKSINTTSLQFLAEPATRSVTPTP